jgi:hypothetical protein
MATFCAVTLSLLDNLLTLKLDSARDSMGSSVASGAGSLLLSGR